MSGARYNSGKRKLSLVLEAQHALEGCAEVLEFGMTKYSRGNWRKGLKVTEICDSLSRHLTKYLAGEDRDIGPNGEIDQSYSGLPHVDHILCNALFLAELTRTRPELDDRGTTTEVQRLMGAVPQAIHDWAKGKVTEMVLMHQNKAQADVADAAMAYACGVPYEEPKEEEENPFQPNEQLYAFDLLCAIRGHS